jgi:succinate dehydrogenase/fumarate reductase flavoprotein subunit
MRFLSSCYDVIVIGGGAAGLAAAVEAAQNGRSVALLEKGPKLGGTTSRAIGSITANRTSHQRKAGIIDSPQAQFDDMSLLAGPMEPRDNLSLRRLYTEQIADTFRWLQDHGIVFLGPLPEEPHRVPRMHNALPGSNAYIHRLSRAAKLLGVEIHAETRVSELVYDGRVRGVVARQGKDRIECAARAVVIASGDFSSSTALKAEFLPQEQASVPGINPLSTGDGQMMARAIGAQVVNGDLVLGPQLRFVRPPRRMLADMLPGWRIAGLATRLVIALLPPPIYHAILMKFLTTNLSPSARLFAEGAVLVDRRGERISETNQPALAVAADPANEAFIVFDAVVADRFREWPYFISTAPGFAYAYLPDYARSRKDVFHHAKTLDELADSLEVSADALRETVAVANAQRQGKSLAPIECAPFYGLGPVQSVIPLTDGGLAVNESLAVLDLDGSPVPGLFAAGSAGQGGVLLGGHGHHLGWAFVSGRIAGRSAAAHVHRAD